MRVRAAASAGGQSLVEVVAMAPIVVLSGLLALQALAAGADYVYADNAAHAGALAAEMGDDPIAAARSSLPGWMRGGVRVRQIGDRVTVRLRPRSIFPSLAALLEIHSSASFASTSEISFTGVSNVP